MGQTVSDFGINRLLDWGVRRIYGYPGDGINGLCGALDREQERMQFVQTRHEELAAFMACAHAKFTGEVGVCLATSGPGAIRAARGEADHHLVQLLARTPGWHAPRVEGKALVHGHCHHRPLLGVQAEEQVLDGTGLDCDVVPSTCCGMAGSFGSEKEKYDVSVQGGEHVLLPAVRQAAEDTLVLTDGFSCRADRAADAALHLAQVLRMGLRREHEHAEAAGSRGEHAA